VNRPHPVLAFFLFPLALLYGAIVSLRNWAFDRGVFKSTAPSVWRDGKPIEFPVLSIGNLSAGGTGKTPLTELIVAELLRRKIKVGVVSRGYGGSRTGVEKVRADGAASTVALCGDEPAWLAQRFPQVPVYVGADRVAVSQQLVAQEDVQLLVADDAFQHRKLSRALNVVVLDATEPRINYRSLPLGRLRESFSAIHRADVIFITKVNLAQAGSTAWLREVIASHQGKTHLAVFEFDSIIDGYRKLSQISRDKAGQNSAEPETAFVLTPASAFQGQRILLVSGIAQPATFHSAVEAGGLRGIAGHLIFTDHHSYSEIDLKKIRDEMIRLGATRVVVTEKDAVKLGPLFSSSLACGFAQDDLWVSQLRMQPRSKLEEFYEMAARLIL
jgi:tetraacyldisaccharide 4'-kinase